MRAQLPAGPYLVVGLARSGQAAARALAERGAEVIAADAGHPPGAEGLRALGVETVLDGDGVELVERAGSVVKSPGVPRTAPAIARARERGIPVIGELELGWRLLPNRFVAVTGTNGKTTVAELLGHVWETAGEPVAVAGNVGTPVASLAGAIDPAATVIAEVSSFQLEDADTFAPEVAVLLNLTPDHLDRHGTFAAYRDAKLRLFANQDEAAVAIFNGADPAIGGLELPGRGRRIDFSALIGRHPVALPGAHNAANAAAAAAAASAAGIGEAAIEDALASFAGIPNRLELVAEVDGVAYVNDSKATNPAAAAAALGSYEGGVRAILGGSLKGDGFADLVGPVIEHVTCAYLIGAAADALESDLEPAWEAGVERSRFAGLEGALRAAAADARRGETVLLAPACASFDQYRDYEQRGEHFRDLVRSL